MASTGVNTRSTELVESTNGDVVPPECPPTGSATERTDNVKCPWRPTIVLSFANFAMGLVSTVFGTTLLHMSFFFHVSVATMSLTLTLESVGFLVGSVLFGIIGSRLDYDFLTATTVVLMGLTTSIAPLIFGFPGFVTSIAIRGVATGLFHPLSALYCINAWMRHRYRDSAVQVQNAINAVGATVAPFIINVFLVDIKPERPVSNATIHGNDSGIELTTTEQYQHVDVSDVSGLDRVTYAYIVIGLVTVACGVPAVVLFVCRGAPRPCLAVEKRRESVSGSRQNASTSKTDDMDQTHHKQLQRTTVTSSRGSTARAAAFFFVVILCLVGCFCGAVELIPRSFLTAFAVKQLSWSSSEAALLMSVLGAANGVGRVIGVPLSACLPPGRLLIGQAVLTTIGLITLLIAGIFVKTPAIVAWLGVAVIGLGISTLTGLVFLILFEYRYLGIVERATISASVSTGITIGSAMSATLVGHLSDRIPLSLIYFTAGSLACMLAVLGIRLAVIDLLKRLTSTASVNCDVGNNEDCVSERTPLFGNDN